ncbi:hypothetical protein EOM82_01895 [bacterium]|nr:hypothetical protein [bacterium]
MIFNDHSKLEGQHAFLGASSFRWINWSDDIFQKRYYGQFAQILGTCIHKLVNSLIKSRTRLSENDKKLIELELYRSGVPKGAYNSDDILLNLIPFVNDAIGFHMQSEVVLYYSLNCFGTTDAISYNEKEKFLRIHDLKTGITPSHMEQLLIYTALFCLEYHKKPADLKIELRIYQNFDILIHIPEVDEIEKFMHLIISRNKTIMKYIESEIK